MKELVPFLIILFLGYATGIFYVLSMMEKPIWSYMYTTKLFPNQAFMRQLHSQLKRLITLLPPTMIISMACAAACIIIQYLIVNTTASLVLVGLFFIQLIRLVIVLKARIKGVQNIESDEEYSILNNNVIKLAQIHHEGLLMTLSSAIVQLFVVFFN